jgi:heptaprenyl diphosphate synthase
LKVDRFKNRWSIEVVLVLLAVGTAVIEGLVPKPVPFLRFGLANVVTVAAIVRYGTRTGLMINILRSTGAALFLGTLVTPTYLLSLAGGITSAIVMGSLKRVLSITGISVSGSMASLLIQLLIAGILLPGLPVRELLPLVSIWGMISGAVTGIIAAILLRKGFPWLGEAGVDSPCLPT